MVDEREQRATVAALTAAGFDPKAAADAVQAQDLSRLDDYHCGRYSVRLPPPAEPYPFS